MKRYIRGGFFMSVLVLSACLKTKGNESKSPKTKIESAYTNFSVNSCKKVIDRDDPNETPFRLCPGVGGYRLFVRHVGSGRQSIGVAPPSLEEIPLRADSRIRSQDRERRGARPARREEGKYIDVFNRRATQQVGMDRRTNPEVIFESALNYHEVITRHMLHLDDKAEWRVLMNNGKKIPIALIVKIFVHENQDKPEKVTSTYFALAKITKNEICVTDKIIEGSLSKTEVRKLADTAHSRKCLKP